MGSSAKKGIRFKSVVYETETELVTSVYWGYRRIGTIMGYLDNLSVLINDKLYKSIFEEEIARWAKTQSSHIQESSMKEKISSYVKEKTKKHNNLDGK